MTEFKLQKDYIELCKLLKYLGLTESGGTAKEAIDAGQIQVDGQVETRRRCKIHAGQTVACGAQIVKVV